jgi:hypothetical protein
MIIVFMLSKKSAAEHVECRGKGWNHRLRAGAPGEIASSSRAFDFVCTARPDRKRGPGPTEIRDDARATIGPAHDEVQPEGRHVLCPRNWP